MRVAICQPALPSYRVPVFRRLGETPGIELTVFSGSGKGSMRSVDPIGAFRHVLSKVYYWTMFGREFRFQLSHLRVVNPKRFDVVILPWDIHYLSLFPAILLSRVIRAPVVLWGHGYSQTPNWITDCVRNTVGRMADAVLLYSHTIARDLTKEGFDERRVFVAQNAIDQTPIQRAKVEWLEAKERLVQFQAEWKVEPERTVIFVSRLEPSNRADLLIDALASIRRLKPDVKLVIVGSGPDMARLEAHAKRLNQERNVIFTGAIYEESLLAPWMLSATLFSYPVNIGLSLLHAFGYGLPVVTSDNVGKQNPEIEAFVNEQTGLFYRDGDVEDMAHQWNRIMDDKALRARMSSRAIAQVVEKYNLDRMIQGFVNVVSNAQRHRSRESASE